MSARERQRRRRFHQGEAPPARALRNTSTLVLINGRRMANSATAATATAEFVVADQVGRGDPGAIEILADGASAIYGSDAVSGVVNMSLKSDYEGFEAGAVGLVHRPRPLR